MKTTNGCSRAARERFAGNHLKASWHQEWEVGMQQMIEDELLLEGHQGAQGCGIGNEGQLGDAQIQICTVNRPGRDDWVQELGGSDDGSDSRSSYHVAIAISALSNP